MDATADHVLEIDVTSLIVWARVGEEVLGHVDDISIAANCLEVGVLLSDGGVGTSAGLVVPIHGVLDAPVGRDQP